MSIMKYKFKDNIEIILKFWLQLQFYVKHKTQILHSYKCDHQFRKVANTTNKKTTLKKSLNRDNNFFFYLCMGFCGREQFHIFLNLETL